MPNAANNEESSKSLPHVRSGLMSRVSNLQKEIEKEMSSRNEDKVNSLNEKLQSTCERLVVLNNEYTATLTDKDKVAEATSAVEALLSGKNVFDKRVKKWLLSYRAAQKSEDEDDIWVERKMTKNVSKAKFLRKKLHLEIEQLKRRQAADEERRAFEDRQRLLEMQEQLELALFEEQMEEYGEELPSKLTVLELRNSVNLGEHVDGSGVKFEMPSTSQVKSPRDQTSTKEKQTPKSEYNPEAPAFKFEPCPQASQGYNRPYNNFEIIKPELEKFKGDSTRYNRFIHTFKVHVESKTEDNAMRLSLLIQLCEGKVKAAIENCDMYESPEQGYKEALRILYVRYGRPHTIAQSYTKLLTNGPTIKPNDSDALNEFANDLNRCKMSMAKLGYNSDLNNTATILKIIARLPMYLKSQWAVTANRILAMGREPTFVDVADFVENNAQIADTVYGRSIASGTSSRKNDAQKRQIYSTTTQYNGSRNSRSFNCLYCDAPHKLQECANFKKLTYCDKMNFVRSKRLCDNCLIPGHIARRCYKRRDCEVSSCRFKHNSILHPPENYSYEYDANVIRSNPENNHSRNATISHINTTRTCEVNKVCLKVVPVDVKANNKVIRTYALIDSGSDSTVCTKGLIAKLGLKGKPQQFCVNTIDSQNVYRYSEVYKMNLSSLDGSKDLSLNNVIGVQHLPIGEQSVPSQSDISKWPHLMDVNFNVLNHTNVDLLIGTNVPEMFWCLDQITGEPNEPFAVKTPFGWTLVGPLQPGSNKNPNHLFNFSFMPQTDMLTKQVERLWKTDFPEHDNVDKKGLSLDDKCAMKQIVASTKFKNGHYEIRVPWKLDPKYLRGNKEMAYMRMLSLRRRLLRDDVLRKKYFATVDGYISDGYAHKVSVDRLKDSAEFWFVPHHPVLTANKTRVVFDCAAKYNHMSLNSFLYQGPDLNNSLVGVLSRFRKYNVAIVGDIKAMYHQVKLNQNDQQKFSFLWWSIDDLWSEPEVYQMTSHPFGATSSPCVAIYELQRTATDNADMYSTDVIDTIHKCFYVDDCLTSVNDKKTAITLCYELQKILASGGFKIEKWISNNENLIKSIPQPERADAVKTLDLSMNDLPNEHKALGVTWDVEKDTIGFKVKIPEKPFTRRGILSLVSGLYDPLGIVAPFCLAPKLLLQDLCRRNFKWDEEVNQDDKELWQSWLKDLPNISSVAINRNLQMNCNPRYIQLHCFSDASSKAYGAVCYIRIQEPGKDPRSHFLMGKSRLAPIKQQTIPRLELTAAVLSVAMVQMLVKELDIDKHNVFYWCDSTIVLHYLHNHSTRYQLFVTNRISKILLYSSVEQWRHVPGKQNPADEASRGLQASGFQSPCRWLEGPPFLKQQCEFWPSQGSLLPPCEELLEIKHLKTTLTIQDVSSKDSIMTLFDRYSSWDRLVRAVCWLQRFTKYLANKNATLKKLLSVDDYTKAECSIIKYAQRASYPGIMNSKDERIVKGRIPKTLSKLHPFLDSGILKVGGRLKNAPISDESKYPIIIPKGKLGELLIRKCHLENGHVGPSHTWSTLRKKFWLVNGNAAVRKTIGKCLVCMKRNAAPSRQLMADLPKSRVTSDKPPFWNVGVDYFGPFNVKQGRSLCKRYGCIFTCLSSRAVHLEIAYNLDASSFLNVFRRFCCRRGVPNGVYSDNGTNFTSAERILRTSIDNWNTGKIEAYMLQRRVNWYFNPPLASHMGGAWERLIRSIKKIFYAILQEQTLTEDTLHTVMVEAEGILNSRPLTPVCLDASGESPLTPNDLLLLRSNTSAAPGLFDKSDSFGRRQWRQAQYITNLFWQRWIAEYLPLLQERNKWKERSKNLQEGDVILMTDLLTPRGKWMMGIILKTYPDKYGDVRMCDVKTKTGIYKRPITKLCLLDIKYK